MNNYLAEISELADKFNPNEICGFLHFDGAGSLRFYNVRNCLKGEQFVVDPNDVRSAFASGTVGAFAHSHCANDEAFSEADIESINITQVPWFVYSTKSRRFNFRRPDNVYPPLVGREYILGMHDCVGLIADYFKKFYDLSFPFFCRTHDMMSHGYPLDHVLLLRLGFQEVKTDKPEINDVVLIRFNFNLPVTHAGVIVKDDLLLHQITGKVSCVEQYSGVWERMTRFVFRHPKFTSKLSVL